MVELADQRCQACKGNSKKVSSLEIPVLMEQISKWQLKDSNGVEKIQRIFNFSDFQTAIDFTILVGKIAEEEGHHPAILTEWGKVKITWWTHKINGLHYNDFIMAAKCDRLFTRFKTQPIQ